MIRSSSQTANSGIGIRQCTTSGRPQLLLLGEQLRRPLFFIILMLFPSFVSAQTNLSLGNVVQATCGSAPVLNFHFVQPAPANVFSLQFDLRFFNTQFQSVFVDDGDPENDKPIIKKITGALPEHVVSIIPIPESDAAADGYPGTAQWRVTIYDDSFPFGLVPEGANLSLQFFTETTATNGTHSIELTAISGSDDTGSPIWTLTGSNGQIALSGCATPSKLFLPLIVKQ